MNNSKRHNRAAWGTPAWHRLYVCIFTALLAIGAIAPVYAQSSDMPQKYKIQAGSLDDALNHLATQSKLQIVYPPDLVKGKTAASFSGLFTWREALQRLLKGSGLTWGLVNDTTVVIKSASDVGPEPRSVLPPTNLENGEATELNPVLVTGSHIRRTELEGPSPVIIITRQDLDRSGRATVAEALARLPQNFASPITVGSTGTGTQGVNLRGLGKDNTLILLNGRRVASSGSSSNTPFVDLNSIPLAAVERIEVLTDGASALYGSDAVTGVVNIILKKEFVGSEISFNFGASQEGGGSERRASFTTGWAGGGLNALISGEYFNRSRLATLGRSFSKSDDRRAQGGRDGRLDYANPGTVFSLDGQNLPGLDVSFAGIPTDQDGRGLTPADFSATAGQLNRSSLAADFNDLVPESERFGLNVRLNGALSSRLTVFADAGISHAVSESSINPPLFNVVVPETNPFNPFGVPVRVNWLATELPVTITNESNNRRGLVGVEGSLSESWIWEAGLGYSRDEFERRVSPVLSSAAAIVSELLGRTDPAIALNVFGDGAGANTPEVLADMGFGRNTVEGVGDVLIMTGKADGPVLEWAGRELRAALGWEYRKEGFDSTNQIFQREPHVPSSVTTVSGDREVVAGFVELGLPLFGPGHSVPGLRALELQIAARFEHYSDFGNTADPKLAVLWHPIKSLAVRGSMGTSFRAPSLNELYRAVTPFVGVVSDPQRNNESVIVETITGGNPNLEPEESRNWSLGFMWDASFLSGLSLSVDFWGLSQRKRIMALTTNELLAAETFFPDRVTRATPSPEDIAAGLPGRLLVLDRSSINTSEAELRGVDAGMNYVTDSAVGRFDLRFEGAYIYRATRQLTPVAPVEHLAGVLSGVLIGETADRPEVKFRANLSLFWSRGAWEVGMTERYTGRSRDPFSMLHPVVDDQFETDIQVNYDWVGSTGWLAGTRLSLGGVNVFNNKPPFRDGTFGFSAALHDPRQAFYYLQLVKSF